MCGGMVCSGKPDDKKETQEESKKSSVLLCMGIFFDGTLNSIANIDERKDLAFAFHKALLNLSFHLVF